jgi:hypothetical protein
MSPNPQPLTISHLRPMHACCLDLMVLRCRCPQCAHRSLSLTHPNPCSYLSSLKPTRVRLIKTVKDALERPDLAGQEVLPDHALQWRHLRYRGWHPSSLLHLDCWPPRRCRSCLLGRKRSFCRVRHRECSHGLRWRQNLASKIQAIKSVREDKIKNQGLAGGRQV